MTNSYSGTSHSHSGPGGNEAKEELRQDAQSLKHSAGKQAEEQARRGRDEAVGTAKATGSALDRAAEELRGDDQAPDWLASMLSSASRQLQQVASELDGKEPREMMRSVQQFGRRQPGMFLAASAAAGFAAGRYLRAGAEQHGDIDAVEPGDPLNEGSGTRRDRRYDHTVEAGTNSTA
ncbi:MAG: hypothetical protein WA985_00595, partial [Erythrobacter sp.]